MSVSSERSQDGSNAAFCAELVRDRDFPRYAATLFLPPEKRRALLALYAFNVEVSRVRDQISQPLPGEIRLQWWTDLLEGGGQNGAEGSPVAAELLLTMAYHHLPAAALLRLIEAHIFDVYDDQMTTLDALESYCNDTSSTLFSLSARILAGASEEADHVAHHAGIAQGLADVIASLPLHASRGQLYLPRELLDQHGVATADIFAGKMTPGLHEVVEQLRAEGVSHLDSAGDLLPSVPEGAHAAFLRLALIRRILTRAARPNADLFKPVEGPSRLATLWTLWRASRARPFRS
jgi:phytoene synthase